MAKAKTSITTENRSGSAADAAAKEQRTEMPLSDLHPFEGHPFKVLDDELMEQTVESIKQIGVVSPLIVRPDPEGGFEILSVAACIANALLDQGIPVLMTNFSKILNQMGAMYSEERYRYIASFSNYSLLILDDLGIERSTEYALEQVYAVIDERYKSGLPVIITTNLKIAEIRNPQDVAYARIYSRILEMCTPVRISGEDRRKSIGKEKQQVVKEVLDL